ATRSGMPLIQGTSSPGATITIIIHSKTPQTSVVTADTKGNWEMTPPKALSSGTYTVVVTALDPTTGTTETSSTTFSIGGGIGGLSTNEDLDVTTGDELPESGSIETTLALLFMGSILVVFGVFSLTKQRI
ncbi:Ig-like domain-containing protein, partial [Patescibacteria group bacterium]|nr:Ig-like domain-containing protein [Patescibacteria group bacterium]